jgi:hypothetical protein
MIEPPGLWMLHRECAIDTDGLQGFGVTVEASGEAQVITLLASVPLTDVTAAGLGFLDAGPALLIYTNERANRFARQKTAVPCRLHWHSRLVRRCPSYSECK